MAAVQNGTEFFKLLTMFYSYFSVMFNQFQKSGQELKQTKDYGKFAASMMFLWIMPVVIEKTLLNRGPGDDEEDIAFWIKEIALYPANAMVGVRDAANAVLNPQFGFQGSPAVAAADTMFKGSQTILKAIDPNQSVTRSDVKNFVVGAGIFYQLPTRQAWDNWRSSI